MDMDIGIGGAARRGGRLMPWYARLQVRPAPRAAVASDFSLPLNTSLDIYPHTMVSEFKTCNREGSYDE